MTDTTTPGTGPASYTIQGQTVTLPCEIREAYAYGATFLVDAAAAQRVVDADGAALEVLQPLPGRAMVSVPMVRYVDGDLGPYHEMGVGILVRGFGAPPASAAAQAREYLTGQLGAYIHDLPVNQGFTLEAGRSIWGFPKYMAEISIDDDGRHVTGTLVHDGRLVLALTVRPGRLRFPLTPGGDAGLDAYSCTDGVLRRTRWSISSVGALSARLFGGASLVLGDHPVADRLRALGLPKRATMTFAARRAAAAFGAAEECAAP